MDSNSQNRDLDLFQISQIVYVFLQKYTTPDKEDYEIILLPAGEFVAAPARGFKVRKGVLISN